MYNSAHGPPASLTSLQSFATAQGQKQMESFPQGKWSYTAPPHVVIPFQVAKAAKIHVWKEGCW